MLALAQQHLSAVPCLRLAYDHTFVIDWSLRGWVIYIVKL
jgi:hypothetical protein